MAEPAVQVLARAVDGVRAASAASPDPTAVAYRLLLVALAARRGVRLPPAVALRGIDEGIDEGIDGGIDGGGIHGDGGTDRGVLVGALAGACAAVLPAGEDARPDPQLLGRVHQRLLDAGAPGARRASGSFYTPQPLVEHLLDLALEPALDEASDPRAVTVLDPACGTGVFLVAAARRIARRGVPLREAVGQVHGIDLDAGAAELARVCLWLEALEDGVPALREVAVRAGDALLGPQPRAAFDVVVGNPPFLNQLTRSTARGRGVSAALAEQAPGVLGPYTDLSAVFLHRAVGWVREGGRVALVQPQSLLAARDAAGVRRHLARSCALEHLWASDTPVFDAQVLTCAPVLRRGAPQGAVRRTHGPDFREEAARAGADLAGEWSPLLAAGLGIPEVVLAGVGTVGDLARCTADFRDQYYGLAGAVHEAADRPTGAPLVTSGLVAPARLLWGDRPARFLKRRWSRPVVDVESLAGGPLAGWAEARLVPKVLVGTQGRVLKAVVDEDGRWLPSVPTITVTAPGEALWHLLAVLLAPPVSAHAAAAYAGAGLSMRAVKLSARQVAALPLPPGRAAWDEGAGWAARAQAEPERREEHLWRLGQAMCAAYGAGEEVLGWWAERAGLSARP